METGGWLLGGEFEDSVFEEGRERRSGPPASYRAKLCEPQWFYEETESSDDVEALTLKKFRGDLAYRRQDYQVEVTVHETALLATGSCSVGYRVFQGRTAEKALQEYSSISEKLPPTNFAMKRDVQEGQARCLARLGRRAEALEIAADLETRATNTDHLTSALHLRLTVWSGGPASGDTVLCLQKLISLHPFNPWNWGRLAEAYLNLEPDLSAPFASCHTRNSCTSSGKTIDSSFPHTEKDCPLCCPETLPESSVFPMETSSHDEQKEENALAGVQDSAAEEREAVLLETQMKACASLIRTRLLLQLSQPQQTSFALERNLRTQEEIEDKMKGFGFQEDTLLLITEVMGKDIVPEKIKDEVHSEVKCVGSAALSALVVASSKEFEAKWFGKIKDHLCSSEGPVHAQIQISDS